MRMRILSERPVPVRLCRTYGAPARPAPRRRVSEKNQTIYTIFIFLFLFHYVLLLCITTTLYFFVALGLMQYIIIIMNGLYPYGSTYGAPARPAPRRRVSEKNQTAHA